MDPATITAISAVVSTVANIGAQLFGIIKSKSSSGGGEALDSFGIPQSQVKQTVIAIRDKALSTIPQNTDSARAISEYASQMLAQADGPSWRDSTARISDYAQRNIDIYNQQLASGVITINTSSGAKTIPIEEYNKQVTGGKTVPDKQDTAIQDLTGFIKNISTAVTSTYKDVIAMKQTQEAQIISGSRTTIPDTQAEQTQQNKTILIITVIVALIILLIFMRHRRK